MAHTHEAPDGGDRSELPESDVRLARETVDELEDKHVSIPETGDDTQVDPSAATHSGTDDPSSDKAGDAEPPD
ncbi:hypothetical protein [Gordonia insulae]|uniref:Uncharacterized protein n=1 Tax=Gordonia insulae TaxID=2420509 RepID=A0A3G8JRM7_9ACTN|nr:hypothetical protein [Gordonia insulae]AZG47583.1 hypothetical protein D7316_04195 [Gordonia insulae]